MEENVSIESNVEGVSIQYEHLDHASELDSSVSPTYCIMRPLFEIAEVTLGEFADKTMYDWIYKAVF